MTATNPPPTHHSRTLLAKKPLDKSRSKLRTSNPSAFRADVQFRSPVLSEPLSSKPGESAVSTRPLETRHAVGEDEKKKEGELRIVEFDFSRAPQPFLDGEEMFERLKAASDGPGYRVTMI